MVVNFEFLNDEPIENVITNLNFRIDKTVYFGYADMIRKYRDILGPFLKKYCDGQDAEFIETPRGKLNETLDVMRRAVQREKDQGNLVFFDVTGGEALPLVAAGILSTETDVPMHIYNVARNTFREQEEGAGYEISREVPERKIAFTVDMLVELRGSTVKAAAMKKNKSLERKEDVLCAEKIIALFRKHTADWSKLTAALRNCLVSDRGDLYRFDFDKAGELYRQGFIKRIRNFMQELRSEGLIREVVEGGSECYRFASDFAKANLTEEGAALEIMTCLELKKYGQAEAGVMIDWDGEVCGSDDVENEIDVIAIDGFIPVIVSCKSGNQANKEAVYELETVARRFGGRYARKILVSAKDMKRADKNRAAEMGIEVRVMNEEVMVRTR